MILSADRRVRYGAAAGLIGLGFACDAVSPGVIGGAIATCLLAVGMILLIAFGLRDLGLSTSPARRVAPAPRAPGERPAGERSPVERSPVERSPAEGKQRQAGGGGAAG